jgi:hypothetical protein
VQKEFFLTSPFQDCAVSQNQQGADFVLVEGFDVIFSLLGEFNKSATPDMKQQGNSLCNEFLS